MVFDTSQFAVHYSNDTERITQGLCQGMGAGKLSKAHHDGLLSVQ